MPIATELAPLVRPTERLSRIADSLRRIKTILDTGESLWTPVIMLSAGYAVTIPAGLAMWGVATLAAHLASG